MLRLQKLQCRMCGVVSGVLQVGTPEGSGAADKMDDPSGQRQGMRKGTFELKM
jgi:hypothetical protein